MNTRFHHHFFAGAVRLAVIFVAATSLADAMDPRAALLTGKADQASTMLAFPDVCTTPVNGAPLPLAYPAAPSSSGVVLPPLSGGGSLALVSATVADAPTATKTSGVKSSNVTKSTVVSTSTGNIPAGGAAEVAGIEVQTMSQGSDLARVAMGSAVSAVASPPIGTYTFCLIAPGPAQQMRRGIITLDANGTALVELLPAIAGQASTTAVGMWTKVGTRTWEIVVFAAGSVRVVNSTTTVAERSGCSSVLTIELVQDAARSAYFGTATGEVFLPGDDPLDPRTLPAAVFDTIISQIRRVSK